jgi:hypothetical protein
MSDSTNIPLGLKTTTQIPLNTKEYAQSELTLKDLGLNNNLAFTYHKGLEVTCLQENTKWQWLPVPLGSENTGLLPVDFTYPANLIAYGVDYSNKKYNFFEVKVAEELNQNNFVRQIIIDKNNLPLNYTLNDLKNAILALPVQNRTIEDVTSKVNIVVKYLAN